MSPSEVVNFITEFDRKAENLKTVSSESTSTTSSGSQSSHDVESALIREALSRWKHKKLQADNIAIIIAYLSKDKETKRKAEDNDMSKAKEMRKIEGSLQSTCN